MSNRELVKLYESESADLSSNIRIFDKLVTNIRHQTLVCQTQTRISGYSSNSNPGFGSRIFDLPFTDFSTTHPNLVQLLGKNVRHDVVSEVILEGERVI